MSKQQKYLLSIFFVLSLVGISIYLIYPPAKSTELGLDLKGGLHVVLKAEPSPEAPVTENAMEQALLIIRQRVDKLGVAEPQISRQGTSHIVVQLPGVKDPDKALEIIGKTALLEFKPVIGGEEDNLELGKTVLTGKYLKSATVDFDQFGKPKVDITFTSEGAKKFDEITSKMVGQRLAIVLDYNPQGKTNRERGIISAPIIQERIPSGRAEITGDFKLEEAKELALVLQTGALPVKLSLQQKRVVGPTLGKDSLKAALKAGIAGLILVALYMVFYYRVLGLITCGSLTIFGIIFWGVIAAFNRFTPWGWTLTLPGVAGIILTIGLAADSSIVIFERVKEEVRVGKSLRSAADKGFLFGFKTMVDADVVTLIAAVILIITGIGPVRGFAISLAVGILIDLFTAFFFTRPLLALVSRVQFLKKPIFIGAKEETAS